MIIKFEDLNKDGRVVRDLFGILFEYKIDAPSVYIEAIYDEFRYNIKLEIELDKSQFDIRLAYETYRIIELLDSLYKNKYATN